MSYNYTWDALNNPGKYPALAEPVKPAFEAGSERFSLATAWWMCGFSHLAYHLPADIDTTLRALGMELVIPFDIRGMQGFVAKGTLDGKSIGLLALRGTNPSEWNDWRTNLNALPIRFPAGGRVHCGFMNATRRVWSIVQSHVAALADQCLHLYYAGHSLGGAIASLADTFLPASAVYTFGMPRVGDADFCRLRADRPVYRIVDCADLVPRVPPEFFSYRHLPDFRFLNHEGEYFDNPSGDEVKNRIEAAELAYKALPPSSNRIFTRCLADHAILNYTEGLSRAVSHGAAN